MSFPPAQEAPTPTLPRKQGRELSAAPCQPPLRLRGRVGVGAWPNYAASRSRAAALIIAAPFSAFMMVGALVLVEVTAGITEASMTRKPSSPCTRRSLSTTAIGSLPMRQLQLAWYTVEPFALA